MLGYLADILDEKLFIVSTLIAAGAYFFKVWGESKRDARYALYLLMDIRKSLRSRQLQLSKVGEDLAVKVSDVIKSQGAEVDDAEMQEAQQSLIKFYKGIDSILFKTNDEPFTEHFEKALAELAKRQPTRAFRIKSHLLMMRMAEAQEQFQEETVKKKIEESFENSEAPDHIRDAFHEALKEVSAEARLESIQGFLEDLNKDMLLLALSSGPVTFCKILYRIATSDPKPTFNSVDSDELQEFLEKIQKRAMEKLAAYQEDEVEKRSTA